MNRFNVLAAALMGTTVLAGSASAGLLVNGDFETGDLTGWTTIVGNGTARTSGTFGIEAFGDYFFSAQTDDLSTITQSVDVSASAAAIDAGSLNAQLTGVLGSWIGDDVITVTASFLDAGSTDLGSSISIDSVGNPNLNSGPLGLTDPGNAETALGLVPVGTRSILVTVVSVENNDSDNDGYADNLDLNLVPVPEPGSLALIGIGGLMISRRRRA